MFTELNARLSRVFTTIGLVGSVLAKEGSLPDVSHFVSGAFKVSKLLLFSQPFSDMKEVLSFFNIQRSFGCQKWNN